MNSAPPSPSARREPGYDRLSPAPKGNVKILVVSDLHYTLPQLDWVVAAAPSFDVVVMAGDHLDIASAVPLDAQAVVIMRYFELINGVSRLIVSSGNHDLTGPDVNGEQAALWIGGATSLGVVTDGDSVLIGDTLFTVCPWWDGPAGRHSVAALLAHDRTRRPDRWIWIYHWPPLGSPTCWTGSRFYGDTELGGWITEFEPDMVLSGHVHQPPFKPDGAWADRIGTTWVFNPGRQTGPIPARIEIDVADGYADWVSLMGREELKLSDEHTPPRTSF
jgi:Icc-related predicted phosphoesterase